MANTKNTPAAKGTVPTANQAKDLAPTTNVGADEGKGTTTIADQVVAKVAGLAIREIPGVYDVGNSAARALGSLRSTVGADDNLKQGISVEVGQTQTALDLTLIVEYPYPVHEVAEKVRESIFASVQGLVGLEVKEVNIKVADVHVPSEDEDEDDKESKELK
ncbi:Asp23/Gls24 family envelope stress response protein [Nanchangia anserum]|uniref:Asp23/Gls24 family envelope stress response protein n=1 Tax=Nanchangia anserum TaxID=2692125 RepID=A0A8I0GCX6_9ACTO|nr:Asp23/Gls24 family envelope stress response protein [Nanchangia anserum]MBD3689253.1 Asp23/Gls24 family envelope stress response protein [Nanchangia anserum]QOX81475.1 Asp23/Gls24 family envelope stress response protein [Nanchangia anserum]